MKSFRSFLFVTLLGLLPAIASRSAVEAGRYRKADDYDLARIVPDAPADDSSATRAELETVYQVQRRRTPEEVAGAAGWSFTELRRFPAAEARQGVASDGRYLYAIGNHVLGKYRADTGERLAGWEGSAGGAIIHLNAGVVHLGRLYCAHSNYPDVPMFGSVEIWNTGDMKPAGSHSFGRTDGSLTWIDRRNGRWIACFVHYGKQGGEPGRGPEWTRLVEFDDEWRQTGGWVLPGNLAAKLGARGYSCSGGAMGPGGHLFVTGHDETELYVLDFPAEGPELIWRATIPVPAEGQAFGFDPAQPGVIHLILKRTKEIITGRITPPTGPRKP